MNFFTRISKAFNQEVFDYQEVRGLVEKIKDYNAGVIDDHLNKYIEAVFDNWLREHRKK